VSTASARDNIFVDVPLSLGSLRALHAIARHEQTTPVLVLRGLVQDYQKNGEPPEVPMHAGARFIRRGVPITHETLQSLNEMAAKYHRPPSEFLQRIVEAELQKRSL
jgi:hypothetical protein